MAVLSRINCQDISATFTPQSSGSIGLRFVRQARPLRICLICDFCSSDREFALGLLHTSPHDGLTCPQLTVPTAKPVVDFHHQVTAHFGQTMRRAGSKVK